MRSALLCVLFAIIVHGGCWAEDENFKPTPIPLGEWDGSTEGSTASGAGTLHEAIGTDSPPAAAAVPAHYWEDALRHSVYLTLVRDKIDQLIGKGVPPDNKLTEQKDDHDLWEKIKTAPFDRLNVEEPAILGDITIMSKGRLLEEQNGLRFTEDEMSKEKCNEEKCNEGVRAYWSVKRVRQRDAETAPGKYHYELTFSVSSQTPKKQKRPYENPVRTFTVKEGTPVEKPQHRYREPIYSQRPQRAVWFHKNIVPTPARHVIHEDGLDRLFSSWFFDDEPPKRYKQVSHVPQAYPPRSKVGHVGAPTEQHHQKHGQATHTYKPQNVPPNSYKYARPPLGPPTGSPLGPPAHPPIGPPPVSHTQQHYLDFDTIRNPTQFTPPTPPEIKYLSSNVVKTTKPAVLPTPPISYAPLNVTMDFSHTANVTEPTSTTKDPDIVTGYTMYSKPKPPPTKMSYFPEHVRPPVFNAPPGVFVTMDKKPFKPMPPLKHMHSFKHNKNKPIDFRPSPQVLDVQFSDPDPLSDAFRPIAMNYGSNVTDSSEQADGEKRKPLRKSKPPKKHDKVKSHRHTTSAPDIITAHNDALGDMDWTSYLGAFAKTTPMVSHKINMTETTTPLPSTTVSTTTTEQTMTTTTQATSTTSRKTKRTRPPPKFTKLEKIKKHKRVTSTTSSTNTTTSSERPVHRRPLQDLLTQASSASTGSTKSGWQPVSKTQNETASTTPMTVNETITSTATATPTQTTTSTMIAPTTYSATTTTRARTTTTTSTTPAPTTTSEKATTSTEAEKSKNRFRQTTLMIKGTSVKHDKWSTPVSTEKNKTTSERPKLVVPVTRNFPRRKGSNFRGYVSTSKPEDRHRENHVDHVSVNPNLNVISLDTSTEATTDVVSTTTEITTQPTTEESEDQSEQNEFDDVDGTEDPEDEDEEDVADEQEETNEGDFQEAKDQNEFMFHKSSSHRSSDRLNEVEPDVPTTTETVFTSIHSVAKNKTKCKKKNNNTSSLIQSIDRDDMSVAPIETTTAKLSTADFLNQIFGFTVDQNETDGNQTHSKYVDNDEDLEEFLHSINEKKDSNETGEEDYEADKEDPENSPFNNDEDNRFPRSADADSSEEDYQDRPFSFLELMAIE